VEPPPKWNAQVYFAFHCQLTDTPDTVGSANIGYFAVNRWTADVWNGVPTLVESPLLVPRQKQLRLRHGITQATIEKYRQSLQFVEQEPRR
jgi:hypothetical protein